MPKNESLRQRHPFFDNAVFLFAVVVLFWVIEVIDHVPGSPNLDVYGVIPRERRGLLGIFLAPFLHGGFEHLISNTLPFLVLGGLVMIHGKKTFLLVSVIVAIVAGSGIWLFARPYQVHIGASTLVFGYLGFLLLKAWFTRHWREALIALAAIVFYGGLVLTLFRHTPGISWEGHAFGFLGGIISAWLVAGDYGRSPRKAPLTL